MSTTYEPGTVAVATVDGEPNIRVFRTGTPSRMGWAFNHADGLGRSWVVDGSISVTDVRPLVVLDLDDPSEHATVLREFAPADSLACLSWLADQIEAQTRPPRIPEPTGFDSAVTARLDRSDEPRKWVRTFTNPAIGSRPWTDGNHLANWSDLVDPVLIRDGIEDES